MSPLYTVEGGAKVLQSLGVARCFRMHLRFSSLHHSINHAERADVFIDQDNCVCTQSSLIAREKRDWRHNWSARPAHCPFPPTGMHTRNACL